MISIEEQIQKFLRSRMFFTCPVLHARMRKMECLKRQIRPPTNVTTRKGVVLLYNNPEDHFCRSDACQVGLRHREP